MSPFRNKIYVNKIFIHVTDLDLAEFSSDDDDEGFQNPMHDNDDDEL
jgi:hypothetical protein